MLCRHNVNPTREEVIPMNPVQIIALALLAAASVLQEVVRNDNK